MSVRVRAARAQHAMAAFMYCSGPRCVTEYNWNVVKTKQQHALVERHVTAETPDPFMDTLRLTADGVRASPNRNVWMHELACSGTSAYGERSPNCCRLHQGGPAVGAGGAPVGAADGEGLPCG